MKKILVFGILLLVVGTFTIEVDAQDLAKTPIKDNPIVVIVGNVDGVNVTSFILNKTAAEVIGTERESKRAKILNDLMKFDGIKKSWWDGSTLTVVKKDSASWEEITTQVVYTFRYNFEPRKFLGLIPLSKRFGNDRKLYYTDFLADLDIAIEMSKEATLSDLKPGGIKNSSYYLSQIATFTEAGHYTVRFLTYTATATY